MKQKKSQFLTAEAFKHLMAAHDMTNTFKHFLDFMHALIYWLFDELGYLGDEIKNSRHYFLPAHRKAVFRTGSTLYFKQNHPPPPPFWRMGGRYFRMMWSPRQYWIVFLHHCIHFLFRKIVPHEEAIWKITNLGWVNFSGKMGQI